MSKKYYLAIALMAILVTSIGVTGFVSADEGVTPQRQGQFSEDKVAERNVQKGEMVNIMANKDFEAFKALMADKPFASAITEEKFNQKMEVHALMQEGKVDEANALKEEIGLMGYLHKGEFKGKGLRGSGERNGDCEFQK